MWSVSTAVNRQFSMAAGRRVVTPRWPGKRFLSSLPANTRSVHGSRTTTDRIFRAGGSSSRLDRLPRTSGGVTEALPVRGSHTGHQESVAPRPRLIPSPTRNTCATHGCIFFRAEPHRGTLNRPRCREVQSPAPTWSSVPPERRHTQEVRSHRRRSGTVTQKVTRSMTRRLRCYANWNRVKVSRRVVQARDTWWSRGGARPCHPNRGLIDLCSKVCLWKQYTYMCKDEDTIFVCLQRWFTIKKLMMRGQWPRKMWIHSLAKLGMSRGKGIHPKNFLKFQQSQRILCPDALKDGLEHIYFPF